MSKSNIRKSHQVYISDPVDERVKQAVNFGAEEKMDETEKVDLIVEVSITMITLCP